MFRSARCFLFLANGKDDVIVAGLLPTGAASYVSVYLQLTLSVNLSWVSVGSVFPFAQLDAAARFNGEAFGS